MNSQNDEEQYILDYFGDTPGSFYDIGAWDGKTFSNVHALLHRGWSGVMVEPEPRSFLALMENTREFQDRVHLVNAAVATDCAVLPFWEAHGDAISSLSEAHMRKWSKHTPDMRKYFLQSMALKDLFTKFGPAQFINLDVEGTNMELFRELPLAWPELRMVCVEHDYKAEAMRDMAAPHGFRELTRNGENLILVK